MLFFAYKYQDEYNRMPDKLAKQRDIDIGKIGLLQRLFLQSYFLENLWSISSYSQWDS